MIRARSGALIKHLEFLLHIKGQEDAMEITRIVKEKYGYVCKDMVSEFKKFDEKKKELQGVEAEIRDKDAQLMEMRLELQKANSLIEDLRDELEQLRRSAGK